VTTTGVHPRFVRRAVTALAGATIALGSAGAAAAAFTAPAHASHAATGANVGKGGGGDPYFVCIAYAHQWGICVGPPTT
jgi:nitrous oxide reductase